MFGLQPGQPLVADHGCDVQPNCRPVALHDAWADPAAGDVVQPVGEPLANGEGAGGRRDPGVALLLQLPDLLDHLGAGPAGDVAPAALATGLRTHRDGAGPAAVLLLADRGLAPSTGISGHGWSPCWGGCGIARSASR